jgi:hypothetical protein
MSLFVAWVFGKPQVDISLYLYFSLSVSTSFSSKRSLLVPIAVYLYQRRRSFGYGFAWLVIILDLVLRYIFFDISGVRVGEKSLHHCKLSATLDVGVCVVCALLPVYNSLLTHLGYCVAILLPRSWFLGLMRLTIITLSPHHHHQHQPPTNSALLSNGGVWCWSAFVFVFCRPPPNSKVQGKEAAATAARADGARLTTKPGIPHSHPRSTLHFAVFGLIVIFCKINFCISLFLRRDRSKAAASATTPTSSASRGRLLFEVQH